MDLGFGPYSNQNSVLEKKSIYLQDLRWLILIAILINIDLMLLFKKLDKVDLGGPFSFNPHSILKLNP